MTHAPTDPRFTWADLEQWTGLGLLRPEQLTAIREHLDAEDDARPWPELVPPSPERRARFDLITVAYYFGAFIILLAGTIFVGLQWEELGRPGQFAASWGAVAGLWLLGAWLKRGGHRLGGDLLIFAGTGIAPLASTRCCGRSTSGPTPPTRRAIRRSIAPSTRPGRGSRSQASLSPWP